MCAKMLMHAIAHGSYVDIVRESAQKVDFERKILAPLESRTCLSGVPAGV